MICGYHQATEVMAFLNSHEEWEQTKIVLHHLFFRGSITDKIAREEYGITRIAAVIWKLKNIYKFDICSIDEKEVNRYGRSTTYSRYYLP